MTVHSKADKIRSTDLSSDNDYPDIRFPSLSATSFKKSFYISLLPIIPVTDTVRPKCSQNGQINFNVVHPVVCCDNSKLK
jgi:hypothetical protein